VAKLQSSTFIYLIAIVLSAIDKMTL